MLDFLKKEAWYLNDLERIASDKFKTEKSLNIDAVTPLPGDKHNDMDCAGILYCLHVWLLHLSGSEDTLGMYADSMHALNEGFLANDNEACRCFVPCTKQGVTGASALSGWKDGGFMESVYVMPGKKTHLKEVFAAGYQRNFRPSDNQLQMDMRCFEVTFDKLRAHIMSRLFDPAPASGAESPPSGAEEGQQGQDGGGEEQDGGAMFGVGYGKLATSIDLEGLPKLEAAGAHGIKKDRDLAALFYMLHMWASKCACKKGIYFNLMGQVHDLIYDATGVRVAVPFIDDAKAPSFAEYVVWGAGKTRFTNPFIKAKDGLVMAYPHAEARLHAIDIFKLNATAQGTPAANATPTPNAPGTNAPPTPNAPGTNAPI